MGEVRAIRLQKVQLNEVPAHLSLGGICLWSRDRATVGLQSSGDGPCVPFLQWGLQEGRLDRRTEGQGLLRAAPACAGRASPGPNSLC